ncbi:MAG: response regulator [Myxococcota bacterium]
MTRSTDVAVPLTVGESSGVLRSPVEGAEVLVVDDDPTNRGLLERTLRVAGYIVRSVADGHSALAAVEERAPSLVVLDYMMPGMDGPEVLVRLRALQPALPVVILTASDSPEHVDAAFAAGADDYLHRPVNPRILTHRVASHLRFDRTRREARAAEATGKALEEALEEASAVQRQQLPSVPERWAHWQASGGVMAGDRIGGDVFSLSTGSFGLPIAMLVDVAGHGMAAAIVASRVQSELKALLERHAPADALTALDEALGTAGRYACVAALRLHARSAEIVNAGLPPIALVRGGNVVATVSGSGFPPGLVGGARYRATVLPVRPGDRIVVLSDGLTEPFGHADAIENPLARLALFGDDACAHLGAEAWETRLGEALCDVPAELRDDATVLVIERDG